MGSDWSRSTVSIAALGANQAKLKHAENYALFPTKTCCKKLDIKNDKKPGKCGCKYRKHDCNKDECNSITIEHVCNTNRTKATNSRTL